MRAMVYTCVAPANDDDVGVVANEGFHWYFDQVSQPSVKRRLLSNLALY